METKQRRIHGGVALIKNKYDCFNSIVYHNEDICFYPLYKTTHCKYIAADTETKLYYNGKVLSEEEAYILFRDNGQKWFKENVEVKAYAFTISNGKGFALFDNAEDFLTACAMLNVKLVFWYNARFDFAIFDYYFLLNGWHDSTYEINKNKKHFKHLSDKTYSSLNGEFGQRYQMQVWKSYLNINSKRVVGKFKMIDICNISGGGLAKNLEDWNIEDEDGKPIRKLTMQYDKGDVDSDILYMIADVKGLYYLGCKINETIKSITKFSLLDGDYLTAGGLAIKTLLEFMYGYGDFRKNRKAFKSDFYMTKDIDILLRERNLYLGGKCLINPYKRGVVQTNVYKYDVNSMYPHKMKTMLYPYGKGRISHVWDRSSKDICYLAISGLVGQVLPDKIPIYQDPQTKEFEKQLFIPERLFIWGEELAELEKWYDLSYQIDFVCYYTAKECKGAKKFVDTFYDIKSNSKGAVKNTAKLELNSSYGKLAQRIEKQKIEYRLTEAGYVHAERLGIEIDTKSMLSVLVGSRITALARVDLMQKIREVCKENVKEKFVYCDTDSVHALEPFEDTDPKELGKLKNEGTYKYALYLAPKSYIMQDEAGKYEVHCKGVNTQVVADELQGKNFLEATKIFTANRTFRTLCGVNCKGGKALVYVDKMILNDNSYHCDTTSLKYDDIMYEVNG